MKRLIAVLIAALAVSAYADEIKIDWKTWMFDHNATDLTDQSGEIGILNNYDVLWQLIHTPSSTALPPVLENANYLADGDSLLDEGRYLTGSSHGNWDMSLYLDSNVFTTVTDLDKTSIDHYYVYQRVFELERGTTAPVNGTYYFDSEVTDLASKGEWVAGTPYYLQAFGNAAQTEGVKPTLQVQGSTSVPEPATMSLLGLGALAMVLRRKLRK